MSKFVDLNEAAKMLGVSPEELVEMRSSGDIHGYRDGTSWKFKTDEVERAMSERGGAGGEDDESILVSEQELGQSGGTGSSTVIGNAAPDDDSDLKLSGDEGNLSLGSASDLAMDSADQGEGAAVDSDVALVPGTGGSDVALVPDPGSDKDMRSDSGTGELDPSADTGSSGLDADLDSELALSDDDDLVLSGGSGSGSDLSLNAADSGINLGSPSDSGLSLEADSGISLQSPTDSGLSLEEDSLDMGGSSISSLELPEEEEVSLDEAAAVQQDEQFMLSPSDEMFAEESDSGSQVIALEDSEAFDQDAMAGDQAMLDTAGLDTLGAPAAPTLAGAYGRELPEAPYSIWNLLGLGLIILFLSVTGIMMTDIVRNMWAWEEGRDVSSSIAEGITSAVFRD